MQRTLAYALSPAPGLPLRFLLAAPWFGVLAALALFAAGESAFASRWSAPTLGATHLLTLGYLGMAMAGSMLQLIPVVTGAALEVSRAAAAIVWLGLALGAVLLAGALGLGAGWLLIPAALLLACAIGVFIAVIGRALSRRAGPAAMPMVRAMRLALAGLVITVLLGVTMAFALAGAVTAPAPMLLLADLHAAWGLLGWVAMLVVGVAFQVIPMFQSSKLYPAGVTRWASWLLFGLLGACSSDSAAAGVAAALLCAALAAFAVFTAWLLSTRKRKEPDATTLYWRLSLGCLAASTLLYLMPRQPHSALLVGVVFIAGFAMGAVNGMLYKIVPFLLWYHLQSDPRATKGAVPSIRLILPDAMARRQFSWHAAALAALLGAVYLPAWFARPACALLAVSSLLLALDLWRATASCRKIRQQFQPS
ncbi:MAG: permease [Bdellovibrionales bacterium]|nr:permease [Massilia sp.]